MFTHRTAKALQEERTRQAATGDPGNRSSLRSGPIRWRSAVALIAAAAAVVAMIAMMVGAGSTDRVEADSYHGTHQAVDEAPASESAPASNKSMGGGGAVLLAAE